MKLLIYSDLHLEFDVPLLPRANGEENDFDVVVLAGDIHAPGFRGVDWASRMFEGKPTIYVPGNHEFYRREIGMELQARD